MKRLGLTLSMSVFAICCFISCKTNPQSNSEVDPVSVGQIDTLAQKLHQLDSTLKSGQLVHLDIYKIGKLKSIEITVQSLQAADKSLCYINLRKDCGNDYYYSWEDAKLLNDECSYLLEAIETIKSNSARTTDHEERYAYITKDDIRIFSTNDGSGNNWKTSLSVDYRKERSEITLSETDVETFKSLIKQGQQKISELN